MTPTVFPGGEPASTSTKRVTRIAGLAVVERVRPCRGDARPARRQLVNLGLVALSTFLMRVFFPVLGVAFAGRIRAEGIGLYAAVAWPEPLEIALAALALDLVIYWQHRAMHAVPLLWRVHRVHHSDLAFDVTLGVRFHVFEIAASQALKLAAIAVLGAAPLAVLLFEIALQTGALFTHADVALPAPLERIARWFVVTPSLHRVHHSVARDETDTYFGFSVVWWDRLFATFRAAPRLPEATMPVGVPEFRTAKDQGFVALLLQPFVSPAGAPAAEVARAR